MFVYLTTNTVNGKMYVGRSVRPITHTYFGSGVLLKQAIEKYGVDSFRREILEILPKNSQFEDLMKCEEKWIKHFNAPSNPQFYNMSWSSGGTNRPLSNEMKIRISKTMKENVYKNGLPPEWRDNVVKALTGREPWNKGRALSEEEKRQIRDRRKPNKVYSESELSEIRKLYEEGMSAAKISQIFGGSHKTILKIVRKQGKYAEV